MTSVAVPAKLNLALVVGPPRADGLHELVSVVQRIDLADRLELTAADSLAVDGFPEDTLVRGALSALADEAGVALRWRVRITKAIPVAAGLGGGSADAAAALSLANRTLPRPLDPKRLMEIGASVGSDVPFFLAEGPQLVEGAGERLAPLDLPRDYTAVVALAHEAAKASTAAVYARFDELEGPAGFDGRRQALLDALEEVRRPPDLAALPPNDLARAAGGSPLPEQLLSEGAFRADVTGAGPAAFGLFEERGRAESAARAISGSAQVWVTTPVW